MGKFIKRNLIGQKFNMLTVDKELEYNNKLKQQMWHCKCECGGEINCNTYKLIYGQRGSCGCTPSENHVGKTYGNITVTNVITDNPYIIKDDKIFTKDTLDNIRFTYRCNICGNEYNVSSSDIRTKKNNKNAMCYECSLKNKEKGLNNVFDLESHEYGICYFNEYKDDYFIFDKEDYNNIKNIYWNKTNKGYIRGYYKQQNSNKRKAIFLHKYLFNDFDNKFVIDHINRNKSDNRRENLRICNQQENVFNSSIPKNNTSGFIGVYKVSNSTWEASIMIDRETIKLGRYKNIEDAIVARLKAEKEYFGDFAPQRHLFKEYNIE